MKKLLTIAVVAMMAVASQAANINWTIAGKASSIAYGVTAESKDATSASDSTSALQSTVYLILASDLSSLSAANNKTEDDFTTALGALTINKAFSTSDGKKPSVLELPVNSTLIADSGNTTFGMLTYATDSFGNGWYKVVTDSKAGYADGAGADSQTLLSLSWADMKNSAWTKGWAATETTPVVPEPTTGALALAGVALLFRRRKA